MKNLIQTIFSHITIFQNKMILKDKNAILHWFKIYDKEYTKNIEKNVEMKDSGTEWIGMIPKHWEVKRVKDFCQCYAGGTPEINKDEYWENGTNHWAASGNLKNGLINLDILKKITDLATIINSSTKKLISTLKSEKNALIIVVDKLQTGFDEPKLHSLFLDKEIKDINAVQTVCRVNRTCKHKDDCLVVDYSINNINMSHIKNAFDKYAGIVVSELYSYSIKNQVEQLYKKIITTDCYIKFFDGYKKDRANIEQSIELQKFIMTMCEQENGKKLLIRDCEDYLNYI